MKELRGSTVIIAAAMIGAGIAVAGSATHPAALIVSLATITGAAYLQGPHATAEDLLLTQLLAAACPALFLQAVGVPLSRFPGPLAIALGVIGAIASLWSYARR